MDLGLFEEPTQSQSIDDTVKTIEKSIKYYFLYFEMLFNEDIESSRFYINFQINDF